MSWIKDFFNSDEVKRALSGEYPTQEMKSAEQMMVEWIQSQLDENQTFTINSEQYLEVWNWFQSVELAWKKANMVFTQDDNGDLWIGEDDKIDMPDLYNDVTWRPGIDLPFAKWTGNEETMTKYDKRTDTNHEEIREGLRKAGYEVEDTSWIGRGHVDLMVRGDFRTVMLEIKYLDAKLTDAERELHTKFSGCGWHVVRTLEQALDVMRKETI